MNYEKSKSIFVMMSMLIATSLNVNCTSDLTEIVIGYTNDIHGRYQFSESENLDYGNIKPCIGLSRAKSVFKQEKADVIVSAGDAFAGTGFSAINYGLNIANAMKSVGYQYFAVGNHDFYYGQDILRNNLSASGMMCLTGNVIYTETGKPFFDKSYDIQTVKGVKIGFFGVIDPNIRSSSPESAVEGLTYTDDIEHTNKMVKILREDNKCDIVVALTHHNDHENYVKQISGVNLVIAGHLHCIYNNTVKDRDGEDVLVTESGYYLEDLGIARILFDINSRKITNIGVKSISFKEVIGENVQPDGTVELAIDEGNKVLEERNPVIANGLTPLGWNWEDVRIRETDICRVYADSLLEYIQSKEDGIQIAFITPGSLHGSIIEKLRRFTVPNEILYNSDIVVKKLTGKIIKNVIEASLEVQAQNLKDNAKKSTIWDKHSGDITYLSKGMEVSFDLTKEKGSRIQSLKYNGTDLNDKTEYVVALSEFQSNLSDLYPELKQIPTINTFEEGVTAALNEYLRKNAYEDSINIVRYRPVNDIDNDGIQDILLKDDTTGVIVEAPYGVLTENSVLSVRKKDVNSDSNKNIDEIYNSLKRGAFYDIKIYDKNNMNAPITNFKPSFVTVKCPLPDDRWQENTTEVIRVEKGDDVGFEETFETINGKKYVVIKTDHFSDYLLLSKDPINHQTVITIITSLLAIFAVWATWYIIVLRKKINHTNYK